MKAKKIVYTKSYVGDPTLQNFHFDEEELPELKEEEILCEAEYFSVDPYVKRRLVTLPIGITVIGRQIARIIDSKNKKYPKGRYVFGDFGWRTHTIFNPETSNIVVFRLLPDIPELPRSLHLGYLGVPGCTAYFGLLEICKPKPNETVVVSGAAGAVGSLVGQIAKIIGCKAIGIAGSKEKCDWIQKELGFDHAINYKDADFFQQLKLATPNGVDCYFDNTGGDISLKVINRFNSGGRMSICGSISSYNLPPDQFPKGPHLQPIINHKQLVMEGFMVYRWVDRWLEGINEIQNWMLEGKIKYRETITDGFENIPNAFLEMLRGKNFGKALVKVDCTKNKL